jgi:hypothetical protein
MQSAYVLGSTTSVLTLINSRHQDTWVSRDLMQIDLGNVPVDSLQ